MRRGPSQIPNEAFDRIVESFKGTKGLKTATIQVHFWLRVLNFISRFNPTYHFESIGEFLDYQHNLRPGSDRIAIKDVEVTGIGEIADFLQLQISNGPGEERAANLLYRDEPFHVDGEPLPFGLVSSPVLGAIEGDRIQIYHATYRSRDSILIDGHWYVKNDAHYLRQGGNLSDKLG